MLEEHKKQLVEAREATKNEILGWCERIVGDDYGEEVAKDIVDRINQSYENCAEETD